MESSTEREQRMSNSQNSNDSSSSDKIREKKRSKENLDNRVQTGSPKEQEETKLDEGGEIEFSSVKKQIFEQVRKFMKVYQFDKANELLILLEKEKNFKLSQLNEEERSMYDDVKQTMKDLNFMDQAFLQKEEWQHEKFENKVKVLYRQLPENQTLSLMIEAELEKVSLFNLCGIIYEIELFKNWVPFCDMSKTLKQVGTADKVVYIKLGLPVLSDREGYLHGFGVDRLEEHGSVVIICKTLHNNKDLADRLEISLPDTKNVRFDINYFFFEVRPTSVDNLTFRAVCNVDPKMNFIPKWVLNFFIKKIGSYMLGKIIKLAKDIKGTEWEKNQKKPENRPFYEWIDNRLFEYFGETKYKKQF